MALIETVRSRILAACPDALVEIATNPSPSAQHSLRVGRRDALKVAQFLAWDPELLLDSCSNVTGVDWLPREERVRTRKVVDGVEKEVEENLKHPGYLEVVYHLYSIRKKQGPVILRLRTEDRASDVTLPSLTPVWRGCELQEREVYDLFGVIFEGHPDLRRLLMWEGFRDHPMRKDYVEPDDFEYEPTAHDQVLERAKLHLARSISG